MRLSFIVLSCISSLVLGNPRICHGRRGMQQQIDKIRGVNLGGWLLLEPWITPSLFDPYQGQPDAPMDEYSLTKKLGSGAKEFMERHWATFVTRNELERLVAAGINSLRIPIGYWALDIQSGEPWVEGSFKHLLRGIQWAKELGLKVMVDIHGAPGSQNGFDNSGRYGSIHFLEKDNMDRLVQVLHSITRYFSQPQFQSVVTSIELINEPHGYLTDIGGIKDYYTRGINKVRDSNNNITIVVHDAFHPLNEWEYFKEDQTLNNRFNLMYDAHRYQVFDDYFYKIDKPTHIKHSCNYKSELTRSNSFYPTVVGEWSLAITDCTKYLNGFGVGTRYEGTLKSSHLQPHEIHPAGSCSKFDTLSEFTYDHRQFLRDYFRQQVSVFETYGSGWYFWNFKAENSPEWNFLLGVEQGWINLNEPIPSAQC